MRNILVVFLFLLSITSCQKRDDSVLSFVLYQGEDYCVSSNSLFPNFLYQLDFEFPAQMHNNDVLRKIQQQLIDAIFYGHYQSTSLDSIV